MSLSKLPATIPIYGDQSYRGTDYASETAEQIGFLSLLDKEFPGLRAIAAHVRNEDKKSRRKGAMENLEGRQKGFPDIIIPTCPPILIELKIRNPVKARISPAQIKQLVLAQRAGAFSCVALGAVGAIAAVRAWHALHGKT